MLQGNLIFTYISEQNVKILITFSVSQNNIQIDISNQAKMTFDNNQEGILIIRIQRYVIKLASFIRVD